LEKYKWYRFLERDFIEINYKSILKLICFYSAKKWVLKFNINLIL